MSRFAVFLVDPNQLFREGVSRLLDPDHFRIVGEARSLTDACATVMRSEQRIDLLTLDIDGLAAEQTAGLLQEIRERLPAVRIVMLTADGSRASLSSAMRWPVDSYLLKDMSGEALSRSLQLVMLGQQVFPTRLMAPLLQPTVPPIDEGAGGTDRGLSPREKQILQHLASGSSNKAIARELQISEATVKVHLKALLRKVRADNRTQAAVWALNNGLLRETAPW